MFGKILGNWNPGRGLKYEFIIATVATGIISLLLVLIFPYGQESATSPDGYPRPLRVMGVGSVSSLQAALADARAGDQIIVKAGVYQLADSLQISVRGTAENPIIINSEAQGATEITGQHGFLIRDSQHLILSGFKFTYSQDNSQATDDIAFMCENCVDVRITRNTFALTSSYHEGNPHPESYLADWLGVTGASNG